MGKLSREEIEELLGRPLVSVVSTIRPDGTPHMTPVWHLVDGGDVVLTVDSSSVKARNVRGNPVAALSVVTDETPQRWLLVSGKAELSTGAQRGDREEDLGALHGGRRGYTLLRAGDEGLRLRAPQDHADEDRRLRRGRGVAAECCGMVHIWRKRPHPRGERASYRRRRAPEEDRMNGTIAIVAPEGSDLEGLLEFAPDDVEVKRIDSSLPLDVKAERMSDVAALFNAGAPFDMELVRRCPRLRLIQSTSAGVDGFDLAALGEMGIQVANNRGRQRDLRCRACRRAHGRGAAQAGAPV